MKITKPMLAGKCSDVSQLRFPLLATPKLDGIRCLKINGKALSRKFIPIGNAFMRNWIESHLPDWVDGELMVNGATFSVAAGDIAREDGEPDFRFYVFDYVKESISVAYARRMDDLALLAPADRVIKILPVDVASVHENRGDVVLGADGVWPNHHAQDRWMGNHVQRRRSRH